MKQIIKEKQKQKQHIHINKHIYTYTDKTKQNNWNPQNAIENEKKKQLKQTKNSHKQLHTLNKSKQIS